MNFRPGFLLLRAIVALILIAIFFALAVGAVAGLGLTGFLIGKFAIEYLRGKVMILALIAAAGCAISALVVLWSLLPRIDRFEEPGPELLPAAQPELFREIHRIAGLTGQKPPAHVYLLADVNAFVTERGGLMGIGSRRVMGLGLALLNTLNVSELRSVMAHEFGHFFGGDTKLGPWIYSTRRAMGRTVVNLHKTSGSFNQGEAAIIGLVLKVVVAPFELFGKFYIRVTQTISRAQELSADALAVRTVGPRPMVEGLKKVHQAALAFDSYMRSEVAPLLRAGALPPIGPGFRLFLSADAPKQALARLLDTAMSEGKSDPYDSHPSLKERIAHVESLERAREENDIRPAIELLTDVSNLEAALAGRWVKNPLKPIDWEESVRTFAPSWREIRKKVSPLLVGIQLGELAARWNAMRIDAVDKTFKRGALGADERLRLERSLIVPVLCDLLLDAGYSPRSVPGEGTDFRRGESRLEPATLWGQFLDKKLTAEEWRDTWALEGLELRQLAIRAD